MSVFLPAIPAMLDVSGMGYWLGAAGGMLGGYIVDKGLMSGKRPTKRRKLTIGSATTVVGSAPATAQKFKFGSAPANTRTETETESSRRTNMSADNAISIVRDHLKVRDKPPCKTAGQPYYFSCIQSNIFASPEGYQATNQMVAIGTISQYSSSTAAPSYGQSGKAWLRINPQDYTVGTTLITDATSNLAQRTMLEYVTCEIDLANLQNIATWVTLDVNVARVGTSERSGQVWLDDIVAERSGITAAVAHVAGVVTSIAGNHGANGIEWPGTMYKYSKSAHKTWKPLKSYSFCLAAGQNIRFKLGIEVNCVVSKSIIEAQGSLSNYLKDCLDFNLTHYGAPVRSNVESSTTSMTYSVTKVGMIFRYRCKFRNLEQDTNNKRGVSYVSYNQVSNNPITNEFKMDIDTDAAVNIKQA